MRANLRRRYLRLPIARLTLARETRRRARGRGGPGLASLPRIFVVNLASRPDRLAGFEREMSRLHTDDATRFEAIADEHAARGCLRSHVAILHQMLEHGWECIMICEDDARFAVDRSQLDVLVDAFLADPVAEVACLAYWDREVEPYSSLYLRTTKSFTTACYLVKASIVRDLLAAWEEAIRQLTAGGDPETWAADQAWKPLQRTRVFVIPIVRAAYQGAGFSDIWKQHVEPVF